MRTPLLSAPKFNYLFFRFSVQQYYKLYFLLFNFAITDFSRYYVK